MGAEPENSQDIEDIERVLGALESQAVDLIRQLAEDSAYVRPRVVSHVRSE